jgi:ribose 5-phosphate isomerase B
MHGPFPSTPMRVALASDHAGYKYKSLIAKWLVSWGHGAVDFGTDSDKPVDYPLFIRRAARAVASGECERGIVVGGSGNGEAIVANRFRGIRCAVCWNVESARLARAHNDANMLSVGERLLGEDEVRQIVATWLSADFDGGRHARRIAEIDA